ncbi:class I SAM-dependent methyltransferase [Vulcanisaeta sp. JCM 16159]|uniref:class I SAM-dependent methyltransferase n=1 Tax=Vulcanisaeta sp. JCM 16159 TaxID=1295371 RepID=UPI0006D079A0|nr:class I SAM-dependent methyltransferase [Vulcanisaeta sp. JCM 16159]
MKLRRSIHWDLYSRPDVYDTIFSWDPNIETRYIIKIMRRFLVENTNTFALSTLDIGCGTGRVAKKLLRYVRDVICLDLSLNMLLYISNDEIMRINADMLNIPIRDRSINVAYSLLATVNHVDTINELYHHLLEVHRVLKNNGMYIVDLVLERPPCIGVCDEWDMKYLNMECTAKHVIESIRSDHFVEVLELKCGNYVVIKSQDTLLLPKTGLFIDKAMNAGFREVIFLKSFTLKAMSSPQGRTFAILIK